MGQIASIPQLKFYLAPTSQSSWSKRPFHVSLSSSLWTDLLMVAMLFRLNEFTLAHLIDGFQGFWQPVTVFFAVYDAWETRVLFDSVFRYQEDLVHHILGIIQWLLLALMATAVTPTQKWGTFDALLFAGLKFAHHSIRVFNYSETWLFSQSKRARRAAGVRCLPYLISWPFYSAAFGLMEVGGIPLDTCTGMWVAGFFVQRLIWAYLKWDPIPNSRFHFAKDATAIKTNVPFKTTRYADWTMLQLGAIILGFMTVPTTSLGSYGVLIFGYTYVACLNLLSYSMNPEDPNQHALIKGGFREFAWLELFSLGGLALMGIAVGLRVHLFYPTLVVLDFNRHYTWVLVISAMVSCFVMFAQEYCHGGQIVRLNGGKVLWMKFFTSSLFVMVGGIFVGTNTLVVAFLILGMAVVALAVLLLQVLNGAFRRQIIKTARHKLMGHFRAIVVALLWLARARKRLRELHGIQAFMADASSSKIAADTSSPNNDDKQTFSMEEEPAGTPPLQSASFDSLNIPLNVTNSNAVGTESDDSMTIDKKASANSAPDGAHFTEIDKKLSTISAPGYVGPHHTLSVLGTATGSMVTTSNSASISTPSTRHRKGSVDILSSASDYLANTRRTQRASIERRARKLTVVMKQEIRTWKVVLNERIYSQPRVFVEGNKATKYRVQWSDLFFDVLFVGVVFRLGDLLLAGIGAGFSEESIHYQQALGGGNTSVYAFPIEAPRSDAVWIFGSVFVAVWAMWQNKLAYGSKVGTGDVAHKLVDMAQGLAVLLCAVNITTPNQMENANSGNAYAVTTALLVFQLSMVGLWVELFFTEGAHNSRARGTASRNIKRDAFTILPLLCSYATIASGVTLGWTTFLWALSWLLPFVMRVAVMRFVNDQNAVRDLHRYVIHRLGDGALIVLGEGVLQIIRAETSRLVFSYLTIALGLFMMTAARIAVWSMDCFNDPSKHAQLLSLDAGLAAYFIRSVSAPALVGMGVALKKMISITSENFSPKNTDFYWLLCGASTISMFTLIVTYELHRFSFYRKWRTARFFVMVTISLFFIAWPPIPAPSWVIVALCLFTWLLSVVTHFFLDDYFQLRDQVRKKHLGTEKSMVKRKGSAKSMKNTVYDDDAGRCGPRLFQFLCCCRRNGRSGASSKWLVSQLFTRHDEDEPHPLDEEALPAGKKFNIVRVQEQEPVRINDSIGPAVGILEKQSSKHFDASEMDGPTVLISSNPSFGS